MGDKKENERKEEDARLEFILQYLIRSSKLRFEKWTKMIANEEFKVNLFAIFFPVILYQLPLYLFIKILTMCCQDIILKFFNTPTERILVMQVSTSGALVPALGIQPSTKIKSSYFIRSQMVKIDEQNYREILIPGDMAPKPIEELAVLVEEVYCESFYLRHAISATFLLFLQGLRSHSLEYQQSRRVASDCRRGREKARLRSTKLDMSGNAKK